MFCSTPAVALARSVPRKLAFDMLFTGRIIDAKSKYLIILNSIDMLFMEILLMLKVGLFLLKCLFLFSLTNFFAVLKMCIRIIEHFI